MKKLESISQVDVEEARKQRECLIDVAKADLERYKKAQENVFYAAGRVENTRSQTEPGASKMKLLAPGVPDTTSNPTGSIVRQEDILLDLIEREKELDTAIVRRQRIRKEIEERIKKIDNDDYRKILTVKYIDLMPLSRVPVFYGDKQKKRKYHEALKWYAKFVP